MKKYTKLFRIKYNNKLFDIYSDENHRKTFLEIKIENGIEKTYYPELKDYIHLELVYNKKSDILYSRKYTFKEKVALFSTIGIAISSFQFAKQIAYNYNLQREAQNYKVVMERCVDNDNPIIKEYMSSEITFDDVRNTLQQNVNIQDEYRKYINLLIDRLEERMPQIDLKIFYYNLKGLSFNIIPNDKWEDIESDGYYNAISNTITLKENYDQGIEKIVVFHELCHVLNNIFYYDADLSMFNRFYIGNYGRSFSEGFTTILTDYLLVDDWQNYFDADVRIYVQYIEMASTQYQILKLLKGKYDLYDYLNGNIHDLEPKLEELGLADITDIMDAYANTLGDITIVDNQEYDNLKQRILELRIKDELNNGKSDIELYNYMYKFQVYEANIERLTGHIELDDIYNRIQELFEKNVHICTKVLSDENSSDWNIRINNKALINDDLSVDNKVNIYKGNNIVFTNSPNNGEELIIFKTYNNDQLYYGIGVKKLESKQYHEGKKTIITYESNIYDVLTGKKVDDYEICSDMISILSSCTDLPLQFYDIDINIDMLEKKKFKESIDSYFNSYENDTIGYGDSKEKTYKS